MSASVHPIGRCSMKGCSKCAARATRKPTRPRQPIVFHEYTDWYKARLFAGTATLVR